MMNEVGGGNDFNAKKCYVMELGKSKRRPKWNYKMGQEEILKTKEEKDLGVVIQVRKLERIHRVATKMVPELRELTYEDKFKET